MTRSRDEGRPRHPADSAARAEQAADFDTLLAGTGLLLTAALAAGLGACRPAAPSDRPAAEAVNVPAAPDDAGARRT